MRRTSSFLNTPSLSSSLTPKTKKVAVVTDDFTLAWSL